MSRADQIAGRFAKRYDTPAIAQEARRRSELAIRAGAPTPRAQDGLNPHELSFVRIEGQSGVGLLQTTTLAELLTPLRAIHVMRPDGLPRFNPLRRITLRLQGESPPLVPAALLARLVDGLPATGGTVHGDFHFGQLIRDKRGTVWIVDFDDLAAGPPESDLGNLIAYLATREETALRPLAQSLVHWRSRVLAAWSVPSNRCLVDRFTMLAAVRRALKMREQGRADLLAELLPILSAP